MHGRMISVFDLSIDMTGSKLLTDKAYREGSPVRRNRSDVVKKADLIGVHLDDRPIANEPRRGSPSKKAGGTPMKMLIAQELSKETESKRKPTSVVARLMGLDDAPPAQQPVVTTERRSQDCPPRSKSAGAIRGRRPPEDGYSGRPRSCEIHSCSYEKECEDVYEARRQPSRTNRFTDQPLQKGLFNRDPNERRMDLVRQKFMEAKRLATDEKLLQSKEFHDALDVLSSNRDLFLKFLEEPNSLFSKHVKELHKIPSPPPTNRITVLKPSKTVEAKGERGTEKHNRASNFSHRSAEDSSQPTRIVVLKPSPAKTRDANAPIAPEFLQRNEFYRASDVVGSMGSREIAEEITRQMRVTVSGHRRDESLLSSVQSNEYFEDESSFDKSEDEYMEEEVGNSIDSEVMDPSSRHSWDYDNRIRSSSSLSSFSRTSYSPESSVIKEAKKRLSERWAMVASNGIGKEQAKAWGGSSTLREMLAVPEVKKEDGRNGVIPFSSSRSFGGEEELKAPSACSSIGGEKGGAGGENNSPKKLSRSKSVPVSSSAYDNIGLHVQTSNSQINKPPIVAKEVTKSKNGKLSLKGKVSSFFSWNKKSGKQMTTSAPLVGTDERFQSNGVESVCKNSDDLSKSLHENLREESLPVNLKEESCTISSPTSVNDGPKHSIFSSKAAVSIEKPRTFENLSGNQDKLKTSGNPSENQDQPSPTSVLDSLFEDDVHNDVLSSSETADPGPQQALSRSAPIVSIARSLSWDETRLETSSPNSSKFSGADGEEQERFTLIRDLLSSSGLDNEKVNTVFARWHSPDSPLDPGFLVKFLDRKEEEGRRSRERRSSRMLLFDSVNAALLHIGRAAILGAYPWAGACGAGEARKDAPAGTLVAEEVWGLLRDWYSGEGSREANKASLGVDGLLRRELVGRGWAELNRTEIEEISKAIGGEVLEDLVGDALLDLISE